MIPDAKLKMNALSLFESKFCRYGIHWRQALRACMVRELKLQYRGWFNLYSRTLQIGFLAFLSATLFFKPGHDTIAEGQRFLLDIFFAALVSIFAGFGKVGHTCCIAHWASNVMHCVPLLGLTSHTLT